MLTTTESRAAYFAASERLFALLEPSRKTKLCHSSQIPNMSFRTRRLFQAGEEPAVHSICRTPDSRLLELHIQRINLLRGDVSHKKWILVRVNTRPGTR
jgi:hypothetical protein